MNNDIRAYVCNSNPLAQIAAQRVSDAALLVRVDVGPASADLVGWASRAISRLEDTFRAQSAARGDSVPATWEALNMARSFAAALAPSHHAGHSHVVGWYERDIQDGLRHVMTMPMSREDVRAAKRTPEQAALAAAAGAK